MNCYQPSIYHRLFCIAICAFSFISNSCNENKPDHITAAKPALPGDTINAKSLLAVSQSKKLLKDAALITRSDNDFESLALQNFSKREQAYSHAGVAFLEEGGYVVYHCMTGHENRNGLFKREPFDSFVDPTAKTGFGIFQYALSAKETTALHEIIRNIYEKKMPFDLSFDLKSDDSLYCTEMIYKSLKTATDGRVVLPVSSISNFRPKMIGYKFNNLFFKKFEYIGIDDLYLNPFCNELIRVKY